jgi:hypothetical protein
MDQLLLAVTVVRFVDDQGSVPWFDKAVVDEYEVSMLAYIEIEGPPISP